MDQFCPAVVCIEHSAFDPSLIRWEENWWCPSWFGLGGFSLQPSEVGKFATALMLAFYASLPRKTMKNWRDRILGLSILGMPDSDCAAARYGFNFGLPEFDFRGVPGGYAVLHRYSTRGCRFGRCWLSTSFDNCIACSGILAFLVFLFLPKQRRFLLYNAFFTTVSAAIMYG